LNAVLIPGKDCCLDFLVAVVQLWVVRKGVMKTFLVCCLLLLFACFISGCASPNGHPIFGLGNDDILQPGSYGTWDVGKP
jgi:hypothetical protein